MPQRDYHALAAKVIDKLRLTHEGGGENDHLTLDTWEWPQGVAVYAMMKVYHITADDSIPAYLNDWYARHIEKGLPERNVNTCAPMLAMTYLYEITKNPVYLAEIRSFAGWIMHEMPRTQEGGLQHITTHDLNEQQLWDDTLYMTVMFLYRAGIVLHHSPYCEEAKYQFLLHIKYLHEAGNGLWYHGFSFIGRHHFANAFWARGNSWFTACAVDFLEMIDDDCVARFIRETWREQCDALVRLQDSETGLWHTLLDHPDSYLETSASAAIAYGLLKGVRLGWLPERYQINAEKAVEGVLGRVDEDGFVGGVSYGTPMGHDLDFYRQIPVCPTAYGQGLTFLMLTEKMR